MKKNKMMRIASVLLVAVLLSTCAISGTYAKYISVANAKATATVAKWDIKLDGNEFIDTATFNLAETWTDYDGSTEVDVEDKLMAPGTAGSFDFVITNDSEVNAKYSIVLAEEITGLPGGVAAADFPVEYSTDNAHWSTDIADAVASGTLAMNGGNATVTVYWRWAFERGTTDSEKNANNALDTKLGMASAITVAVTATITVEQVD